MKVQFRPQPMVGWESKWIVDGYLENMECGILEWNGILEYWNRILEYLNTGIFEYWNIRILEWPY